MVTVFIGFGSNVGDRLDYCDRAVTLLGLLPHSRVIGVSSLYETEPVTDCTDPGAGWFLNGVVRMETDVTARSLLEVCREIESSLGRDQEHRGGPRTLDLDILFYGAHIIQEPDLVIPHPRVHLRRFALVPLAELDPDWAHPVLNRTVKALLDGLSDRAIVRLLDPQPRSRYGSRPTCHSRASEREPIS
ncbi:MAG: 2-amino-4-hydroxy-6-hydroxymethyldihydropteridine diphosphokinase [Nitrospirota bacterium]